MNKIFFTAGPSQLYPTYQSHFQQAMEENIGSISHRSTFYKEFHQSTVENLKLLMGIPETHTILFFSSANEIWERLIQNCVETGSFHFVNGAFSNRFSQITQELMYPCTIHETEKGKGFTYIPDLIPATTDLINFTHNESSTGVIQPLEAVYEYKRNHPEALITLDIVSSAPFPELDYSLIDGAYFSVQKGMGMPAGLGVLIAGEKLKDRAESILNKGKSIGSYHRFTDMWTKAVNYQTMETPNILSIYLLGKVLGDMLKKGIGEIRRETLLKMEILTEVVNKSPHFSFFVKEKAFRSPTVITIETRDEAALYLKALEDEGLIVGSGYGTLKPNQIRIANFPAHSVSDFEQLARRLSQF